MKERSGVDLGLANVSDGLLTAEVLEAMLTRSIEKGMWYVGGDQSQCRYFSRFGALSIKADVMGKPLQIYEN